MNNYSDEERHRRHLRGMRTSRQSYDSNLGNYTGYNAERLSLATIATKNAKSKFRSRHPYLMNRLHSHRLSCLLLCCFAVSVLHAQDTSDVTDSPATTDSANRLLAPYVDAAEKRWSKDIAAFDAANQSLVKNDDAILFAGSSSIRRWSTLATDMAPYRTIRRGYGGAKYTDLAVFCKRLFTPHSYRALVIFVGNGVVGKPEDHTPDQIEQLARHVVAQSHHHQPGSPVFLIEITPCEKRFGAWSKIRAVNARLREVALTTPDTYFIPTASHFLRADGTPRSELFVEDKLHLNADGYTLWSQLIRQRLGDVLGAVAQKPVSAATES